MQRKSTTLIMILSMTASFLLAANLFISTPAKAQVAVKDSGYQVVTARVQSGGDALYIMDNRTGQIAVFTYDAATRGVKARNVRPVSDAFPPIR